VDSVLTGMREKGLLDEATASVARSLMGEGKPLEDAVLAADGLTEESVLRFLAETFEVPYVETQRIEMIQLLGQVGRPELVYRWVPAGR